MYVSEYKKFKISRYLGSEISRASIFKRFEFSGIFSYSGSKFQGFEVSWF
jgi:hypothetical protein